MFRIEHDSVNVKFAKAVVTERGDGECLTFLEL